MMESLDLVPKFDHRFGSLQPNVWLDYFELVANQTRWTDTEKSLKLIAKVNGSLQESLIKAFHAGRKYSNVRSKFLETKISSKDCIGQLSQTFDPKNQNLKIFLKYKREAAKILTQKSEDQIYIESVRRSLPATYQWISSVNDVDKVLAEQLKHDNKFQRKDDQTLDQKKQREIFRGKRYELMKQAYHLSKESDCNVALMIFDKEGVVSQYSSDCMETILTKYLKKEYVSKRLFTNHNIEMAMNESKLEDANEVASSSTVNQTDYENQTDDQCYKEYLRKQKEINERKRQQADALNHLNSQLNNLQINDMSADNARLNSLNNIVLNIARMTDDPQQFYDRYLAYYSLLTQHVYQQEQQLLLANAKPNQNIQNDQQTNSALPSVSENATDGSEKNHSKFESEKEKIENEEEASEDTYTYDSSSSSEDDFCFVNEEK